MSPELAAAGVLAIGLTLSFQAPVNGALGRRVGALWAVLFSFSIGLVLLVVASVSSGGIGRLGMLDEVSPGLLAGGLIGAAYVTVATLSVTRIGAAAVAAATVAGQMSSALAVDHVDALGVEGQAIGVIRVLGAVLLIAGTVLVAKRAGRPLFSRQGEGDLLLAGVVFFAGLLVGIQHPVNATLAETVGGVQSALVNFGMGVIAIGIAIALLRPGGSPRAAIGAPLRWFAGGPIGVVVVLGSLAAVPVIGAAAIAAVTVTGQLAGSAFLDRFGLLGLEVRPIDRVRGAGLLMLLAGTLMVI